MVSESGRKEIGRDRSEEKRKLNRKRGLCVFLALGIKRRVSHVLGRCSPTKLHPSLRTYLYDASLSWVCEESPCFCVDLSSEHVSVLLEHKWMEESHVSWKAGK